MTLKKFQGVSRCLFISLVALAVVVKSNAQSLDPYRRMNDPLAIADLGGPDSVPIYYEFVGGWDSVQGHATGPGIIRNFWNVFIGGGCPDTDYMSLWVDDSLLAAGTARDFFTGIHGLIGPPFDTASSGGEVCETQIPFRKSFVWTYKGEWHWSAVAWQPIDTTKTSLPTLGSSILAQEQASANDNYWNHPPQLSNIIPVNSILKSGDTAVLIDKGGPAYIQQIHFHFPSTDSVRLDQLWIECYWDHCPTPSVAMPLSDLFGQAEGKAPMHAQWIEVDTASGVYELFFPMPFRVHGRILIINQGHSSATLNGSISVKDTAWNPSWGYFATQYHTTTAIPYHIYHPLLHAKGRGRYVGAILNFPGESLYPSHLEGDAYVVVDSLPFDFPGISVHYGGMEDYCDAGWYFVSPQDTTVAMVPFSDRFRGCPVFPLTIYRFHVNAPYNFTRSMDIDMGHGFWDDFTVNFRTSAFYYTEWTPFYASSDTIIAENIWHLSGSGFIPNTLVEMTLDSMLIYGGSVAQDGTFSIRLPISTSWPIGTHTLAVNGIKKPEPITVLSSPKIIYLADSAQPEFSEGDSIVICAYGFNANEQLSLMLGDTIIGYSPTVIVDSDGSAKLKTYLPWVPEGNYYLTIRRADGSLIHSDSTLYVTRTLDYEFEQMPATGPPYWVPTPTYYSRQNWHLSQGEFSFCNGNWVQGSTYTFQFSVPFADTFAPTLFALKGDRYAIYSIFMDGIKLGVHDWFIPQGDPLRDSEVLSPIYLTAGLHTITCINTGHDDSTREYSFGPDNITLRPFSAASRPDAVPAITAEPTIAIFPNPVDQAMLSIAGLPDSLGEVPIRLFNDLGQEVIQTILPVSSGPRSLNMSSLSNGNYWIVLSLPEGMKFLRVSVLK